MAEVTGNNNVSSDFMKVLLALKANIFRDLKVADIFKVMQYNKSAWTCQSICTGNSISCVTLTDVEVATGDYVLCVYCDYDYRANLTKAKAGSVYSKVTEDASHSTGIIVGVVYTTRTNTVLDRLSDLESRVSALE